MLLSATTGLVLMLMPLASIDPASVDSRMQAALEVLRQQNDQGVSFLRSLAAELEAALAEQPAADLFARLGQAYFYLEDDPRAAVSLQRALQIDPDQVVALRFQGLLHLYAKRLPEAELSIRRASELQPGDARILMELGEILRQAEKIPEAVASFDRALELEPENAALLARLAPLVAESGALSRAAELYERLLETGPAQRSTALYNLGQSRQSLGEHEKALVAFEKVVELDPTDWRARAKVVQENQALGRLDARDLARQDLLVLRAALPNSELASVELYCREQFVVADKIVVAYEFFDLVGDRPRLYQFRVSHASTKQEVVVLSLGSYDFTTAILRETGRLRGDERAFHLDSYSPDGLSHETFEFFLAQPTYDEVRSRVVEVLLGQREAVSSSELNSLTEKGSAENGERAPETP